MFQLWVDKILEQNWFLIIERGGVRWISHRKYNTSALQSRPQSPQQLAYNIYKQHATFTGRTEYLPHLESVAVHMWGHKTQGYLDGTMPGPSLSIKTHAKLQKVLQCFTNVDITAYMIMLQNCLEGFFMYFFTGWHLPGFSIERLREYRDVSRYR